MRTLLSLLVFGFIGLKCFGQYDSLKCYIYSQDVHVRYSLTAEDVMDKGEVLKIEFEELRSQEFDQLNQSIHNLKEDVAATGIDVRRVCLLFETGKTDTLVTGNSDNIWFNGYFYDSSRVKVQLDYFLRSIIQKMD